MATLKQPMPRIGANGMGVMPTAKATKKPRKAKAKARAPKVPYARAK